VSDLLDASLNDQPSSVGDVSEIEDRKRRHAEIALSVASQSSRSAGWEDVHLIPQATASCELDEIDVAAEFLGTRLRAPIVIASMTGGHQAAVEINERLGQAAQELGIAVGVGSQRAALERASLVSTYSAVRRNAPGAFVLANVGAGQLIPQGTRPALGRDQLELAIETVRAQALAIHLNLVEELIQPGGDRRHAGILDALADVCSTLDVPVLAKETGAGMARESAQTLARTGVAALDVGGVGGTSFTRIEHRRARDAGDSRRVARGEVFADWGIPTAASILETRATGLPLIATGGVRSGLDAAKAVALGATVVGIGRPALIAAQRSAEAVIEVLERLIDELRMAMLLTGASNLGDLRARTPVLTGFTSTWAKQRGLLER
jgi:isopentenyl-diphosphate delta-isomerase